MLTKVKGSVWDTDNLYTPSGSGAVARTLQSKFDESVSVKDFGAVGDGVTDDTAAFNAVIAYLNSVGTNGAYTGDGFKIHIPRGEYYLPTGLDVITVDGVHWVGDGRDATVIYGEAGSIFNFGDGSIFVESGSVEEMSFVVKSGTTPEASTLRVCSLQHCTRMTLQALKIIRFPKLVQGDAFSGKALTNLYINDIVGQQYNGGVPLIGITVASTAIVGAGLYLNNMRVNLDDVDFPPEQDGTVLHTALVGSDVIRLIGGTWDTIIASNCIFNRYYRGIAFEATTSGTGITNTYWSDFVIDLTNTPIELYANGGNISKFIWTHGWLNGTDGNTVSLKRSSGFFNSIVIKDTDFLNAGLSNVLVENGCQNVQLVGNRFYSSGRLQLISGTPTKTSPSIDVGSDCDGFVCKDNEWIYGFAYYGANPPSGVVHNLPTYAYDPAIAIDLASIAMSFSITGNSTRAVTTHYGGAGLTASNLFVTGNTEPRSLRDNKCSDNAVPEYLGFSSAALPGSGSGNPVTNLSGCPMEVFITGGTITNIVVNGQSLGTTTPCFFTLNHGESFYVSYSVAPTVRRRLIN